VRLPEDEAHHLVRVLRIPRGAFVTVFDGRGNEYLSRVETESRRDPLLRIVARTEPAGELPARVTLAQSIPKGAKMDQVVRDATMLGAAIVQPLLSGRTNVSRRAAHSAAERWRRIAVASAKQCGRAVVPEIRTPVTPEVVFRENHAAWRLLLVEPSARASAIRRVGELREEPRPDSCILALGPEGGWSPEEIALAERQGWAAVSLGRRTIRADAMPVAALAVLESLWGE
jgi:16S rRNA (uracil1498-N3)-methyltransferase